MTVPSDDDLKHAESDALLQLEIGRSAHYYTAIICLALLLDGALVLYAPPNLSRLEPSSIRNLFFLVFPLLGGLFLSFIGLSVKWAEYQLWPWDAHFSVTVGSVAGNLLLFYLFAASVAGYGPTAHWSLLPWLYPLSLAAVSAPLVGFVLTWTGWSRIQVVSLVAAVLPVAFGSALYLPASPSGTANALAISLFVSADLFLVSGSFLHLISSGTRPHERELITSGQTKMFHFADELTRKEQALQFRESALFKREADAENLEMSLMRQQESLGVARQQLDGLEQDYRSRSDSLGQHQSEWSSKAAEVNSLAVMLADKESRLKLREEDLNRRFPKLGEREQRIAQKEGELTRREFELTHVRQELDRRESSVPETEARLETRRQEIDQKTQELLKREADLRVRETALASAGRTVEAKPSEVDEREVKLNHLKTVLDELNLNLGRKARQVEDSSKELQRRNEEQARHEQALASREAALSQKEAEVAERLEATTQRQSQYDAAVKSLEDRSREVEKNRAELGSRSGEMSRVAAELKSKEATVKEFESRLGSERGELEARMRALMEREKRIEALEAEVSLRSQEVGLSPDLSLAGLAAVASQGEAAPVGRRDSAIRDVTGSVAVDTSPAPTAAATPAASSPETLRLPTPSRIPDRSSTGNSRLDSLLLGGIPPKGHVVLVGDAFVGKEVVLYGFLAEGLKRAEPVVILTATRSPDEVGQGIGVVAPQFKEYDQLGRVNWIDASGTSTSSSSARVAVVRGPTDQAGILSALVAAAKRIESNGSKPFRVGFVGLTSVLANAESRAAFAFLQNVVGILKPRNALAMYTLEGSTLPEPMVETVLTRMDGALVFRQDKDRTFLSVKGLGEVQTRDWVECRATNRTLIVGSFALERIR